MFAEKPTEFALTIKPPSGREGDRENGGRSPRSLGITANKHSVIDSMKNIYRRLILTIAQINDIIKTYKINPTEVRNET